MSDVKRYYVRGVHWAEAGEATRECDCSWPCVKVVTAEDYDALVSRLDLALNHNDSWKKDFDSLAKKLDDAERQVNTWHSRYEAQRQAAEFAERGAKAAESRLDAALEALAVIDSLDPRYDANEVHHAARTGRGWTWIAERQVWLNEKGEDMVRGRDYGRIVETHEQNGR